MNDRDSDGVFVHWAFAALLLARYWLLTNVWFSADMGRLLKGGRGLRNIWKRN